MAVPWSETIIFHPRVGRSADILRYMLDSIRDRPSRPRSGAEFVAVMEKAVTCMDRMLGYQGDDRFVAFHYEPRGEEVLWRDGQSYGFATGAWSTFMDEVAPVADHYKVNVGCNGAAPTHVLLVDRTERRAYFAERREAFRFLDGAGTSPPIQSATVVEITREAIARLAHDIWERRGRPEGQDLQNWVEAEAALKASTGGAGPIV